MPLLLLKLVLTPVVVGGASLAVRRWGPAIGGWIVSLPLTFLVSFIVMRGAGLSSNLMSLGGLAFSVGMVVDASIVVVENVRRHLAERTEREHKHRIVVEAVVEVARPVVAY